MIHPINDVQGLDSKATRSLCGFILNNTAVQLYTVQVYVLQKYNSTSLIKYVFDVVWLLLLAFSAVVPNPEKTTLHGSM